MIEHGTERGSTRIVLRDPNVVAVGAGKSASLGANLLGVGVKNSRLWRMGLCPQMDNPTRV